MNVAQICCFIGSTFAPLFAFGLLFPGKCVQRSVAGAVSFPLTEEKQVKAALRTRQAKHNQTAPPAVHSFHFIRILFSHFKNRPAKRGFERLNNGKQKQKQQREYREKRSNNQNTQTLNQMNRKGHTNTALISVPVRMQTLGQVGILGGGWENHEICTPDYICIVFSATGPRPPSSSFFFSFVLGATANTGLCTSAGERPPSPPAGSCLPAHVC